MVTLEGKPIALSGDLPEVGSYAPGFSLVDGSMNTVSLSDFKGKKVLLNIFPSIDTDVCARSVEEFHRRALERDNLVVLGISKDLPFAQKRFCMSKNLDRVITLSGFRDREFGSDYGLDILDSPIAGLYARSVVVIDEKGKVVYRERVPEITREPDYETALAAL